MNYQTIEPTGYYLNVVNLMVEPQGNTSDIEAIWRHSACNIGADRRVACFGVIAVYCMGVIIYLLSS